jgi:hypothetical protein
MSRTLIVMGTLAWLMSAGTADAQHMFLDVNGDGQSSGADVLSKESTIDIWIQTDVNRNGSLAQSHVVGIRPLTINQYEFILRAVGGSVEWGKYINLQPSMGHAFGQLANATDFYTGFGGMEPLPPGKYKLGSLSVGVKSGSPKLVFASSTSLWSGASTSFGSQREGKDGDNTLKFTDDPTTLGSPSNDVRGDWADASGLESVSGEGASPLARTAIAPAVFSVSISPNPANPEAILEVRTTRSGYIRVRIFDLSGRLVRTALAEGSAPAGIHSIRVPGTRNGRPMPSGVYLYRVETPERTVEGKLLIVK